MSIEARWAGSYNLAVAYGMVRQEGGDIGEEDKNLHGVSWGTTEPLLEDDE